MKTIEIYDIEAEEINRICDDNDISVAEFIEMLMNLKQDCKDENGLI